MVEPLTLSRDSSLQGLADVRGLDSVRVIAVRHFKQSTSAQAAFDQAGIGWPAATLDVVSMQGLLAVRRHPEEIIVMGESHPALDALLSALTPGREPEAMAIDLTHGLGVIELQSQRLDEWLARLVDSSAIPAEGGASRCRLVDVPVLLVRPTSDNIRLVADRSLFPYIAHWLAFTHDAAFNES